MINDSYAVTFGVEFEAILSFHESLLQTHLSSNDATATTVKDIPEDTRLALSQVEKSYITSRPSYMGWGLTTPTTYPEGFDGFQEFFDGHLQKFGYRGYGGEPLHIAKAVLPPGVAVHDSLSTKYDNFERWHVTQDRSLVGVDKPTLAHQFKLARRPINTTDLDNWDTNGIELVSRVLLFSPSSFHEIDVHLSSLLGTSTSYHMAFTTPFCGLHVHVGLPPPKDLLPGMPPPTFTLPTLQHLAYLLVIYERAISELHPEHRREGSAASFVDLQPNLDHFFEEPVYDADGGDDDENAARKNEERAHSGTAEAPALAEMGVEEPITPPFSFANARKMIFAQDMTISRLAKLLGGSTKGHIVNWIYVARTNGLARTLEFRQHGGTLDSETVKWWVTFCVGLVRLAELRGRNFAGKDYMGEHGVFNGEGYRWKEWNEDISVWDLLDEMEMEADGKVHFRVMALGGFE